MTHVKITDIVINSTMFIAFDKIFFYLFLFFGGRRRVVQLVIILSDEKS